MNEGVKEVVEGRNKEYADAWARTGVLIAPIASEVNKLLVEYPQMYFSWMMILNKLLRVLGSPTNPDHWLDIEGYALLVRKYITEGDPYVPSK